MEKVFAVKFVWVSNNIQIQMSTKNISPQEALGLLEMAKAQILDNLAKGRKEMFSSTAKG